MPLSMTAWTVLLAVGVALAGLGYEYERRPIYAEPSCRPVLRRRKGGRGRLEFLKETVANFFATHCTHEKGGRTQRPDRLLPAGLGVGRGLAGTRPP
jgi:hypothetical protein